MEGPELMLAAFEELLSRGVLIDDLGGGSWWVRVATPENESAARKGERMTLLDNVKDDDAGRVRRSW